MSHPDADVNAAGTTAEGVLRRSDIGPLATLTSFNLRNGDIVESAVSMFTKCQIPLAFWWVPVNGLPNTMAIKYADIFVKCAMLQLSKCKVTIVDTATTRKVAIILGVARAVMTEFYRLERTDLIAGETANHILTYSATTSDDGVTTVTWTRATDLSEAEITTLMGPIEFSTTELSVMREIVMCAIGIPAVQGASLMATGHHYANDKLFSLIEKQFWRKEPMKTWVSTNTDIIQNALWHNAGHPIQINLKLIFATSASIAEKIRAAGAGSAACRLPAKEPVLKAAETVVSLATNVRQFFEVEIECLEDVIAMVENYVPMVENYVPGVKAGSGQSVYKPGVVENFEKPKGTPEWVVDRRTALKFLDVVLNRNMDATATAFGFFEAYSESGGASSMDMMLASANSLKKLRNQCFGAYMRGKETYADYRSFKAAERAAGK